MNTRYLQVVKNREFSKKERDVFSGYLGFAPKSIVDKIPLRFDKIILDVSCGFGSVLSYLLKKGRTVYGLDITSQYLEKEELKEYFIKADAHHLPFKDDSLDAIFCFEVVEHLNMPDKFLKEAKRTLKVKGIFLITTPTPTSHQLPKAGYTQHISVRERNAWVSKLKELGFKVNIITHTYPVGTSLPSIFSTILTQTVGRAIGYWKRYADVTSTKLLCTKM